MSILDAPAGSYDHREVLGDIANKLAAAELRESIAKAKIDLQQKQIDELRHLLAAAADEARAERGQTAEVPEAQPPADQSRPRARKPRVKPAE